MPFDFQRARPLLQSGNLAKLFVEELGWEPCRQELTLRAGEADFTFSAVAEKRGFTAWLCASADGGLPDHTTRLKLDRALTQTSFEHLIVFATGDFAQQSWTWVRREPGRPLSARKHDFNRAQPGDSLLQKLQILFVSLEEEEKGDLSTITMAGRARAAFDIERVTKAFYRDFDTHRKAFLKFIDGISEVADREWYASVMLNRLMFVYFIQRKGFLDGDPDYLRNRLHRCQQEQGNVTGRWKTGHSRALQNRPLQGALFIPSFLMQARDYFQVYRIKFGAFITSFASGFRTLIISLSE
jgi:hypothetical protein